jgi:hypothetical protein
MGLSWIGGRVRRRCDDGAGIEFSGMSGVEIGETLPCPSGAQFETSGLTLQGFLPAPDLPRGGRGGGGGAEAAPLIRHCVPVCSDVSQHFGISFLFSDLVPRRSKRRAHFVLRPAGHVETGRPIARDAGIFKIMSNPISRATT